MFYVNPSRNLKPETTPRKSILIRLKGLNRFHFKNKHVRVQIDIKFTRTVIDCVHFENQHKSFDNRLWIYILQLRYRLLTLLCCPKFICSLWNIHIQLPWKWTNQKLHVIILLYFALVFSFRRVLHITFSR